MKYFIFISILVFVVIAGYLIADSYVIDCENSNEKSSATSEAVDYFRLRNEGEHIHTVETQKDIMQGRYKVSVNNEVYNVYCDSPCSCEAFYDPR